MELEELATSALVMQLYGARSERSKFDKQSRLLAVQETLLQDEILKRHKSSFKDDKYGYLVIIDAKKEPFVEDWPALMKHIKETGDIDLFEKRLLKSAALLRIKAGDPLPGVVEVTKTTLKVEHNV